jgi:hypothetical protein
VAFDRLLGLADAVDVASVFAVLSSDDDATISPRRSALAV